MNHQAALHEALESLLRDERLAPCWAPLVAPLRRIPQGDEEDFTDAVHEVARAAALSGEPHISELFALLAAGFERLSEPYASGEMAKRLAELSVTSVRCAALGYTAGLEQKLTSLEGLVAEASAMDPETGVLRPRDLSEHLSLEINRCQRMQLPMGVAAVFDAPQEAGAHADRRAPAVGHVLRENLRRYDDVGRLETGEFVAVLPDVSRSGLAAAAERLHNRLAEDPRTVGAPRRMALAHLDCVDVTVGDLLEQVAEALEHARTSDDYICWT
jgi:GGDEF domain-containing protein